MRLSRRQPMTGSCTRTGWYGAALVLALGLAVAGCESPLNLEGVEARAQTPVRRTDMFQQAATNGSALVVVGNHGLILRSTDEGASWTRLQIEGWPDLIGLTACPDGSFAALAAEGRVLVSTDDGLSWVPHPVPTEESPQGITCDPVDRLWVVGGFSTITSSSDGGESWDDFSIGEDTIFTVVQFIDEQRAVVFGEFGSFVTTDDGGETWTAAEPLPNEFYAQDALFIDRDTGWVAGLAGEILHTRDGGATWTLQNAPVQVPIYQITPVDGQVFAVGGEGVLLRWQGGEWLREPHGRPIRLWLRVLQPVDGERLLLGGADGVLEVISLPVAESS